MHYTKEIKSKNTQQQTPETNTMQTSPAVDRDSLDGLEPTGTSTNYADILTTLRAR